MQLPFLKPNSPIRELLSRCVGVPGQGMTAVARADKRTKVLCRRIKPGEIAVIDHVDLDGPAAEGLVAGKVSAVVNAARSISGRYPNRGPEVLLQAGILLIDGAGSALLEQVREGEQLHLCHGSIYRGQQCLATGREMTAERLESELTMARTNLDEALRQFVTNTLSYVEHERGLLFESAQLPQFRDDLRDRHVLIVVRGEGSRQDLATIRGYIRDRRPIIVGVDGAADMLLEQGWKPHIIFGDMDSISDNALRCGAQLIVHAYPDGRCPGKTRLDRLGLTYQILPGRGTSEDVIMLAAYEKGAELLILVGTHFNLIDFLDKARSGMSSTFLVRLRCGARLVDAKGVSRLYHVPYPLGHFMLMLVLAVVAAGTVILASSEVQSFLQLLLMRLWQILRM